MIRILFILILVGVVLSEDKPSPEVKIDQGILKGTFRTSWKGRTFNSFTGIPYAEPPVGDLRFEPPVPAKPWKGVLDATKSASTCIQNSTFSREFTITGTEDCLYLNVFTPKLPNGTNEELLPVMVYIHGGGFTTGSGNPEMYGPDILLDKDIVFVAMNYRLGPLGFLSTQDEVVPGNNGLKDQNLSIKWVKNNIIHFGGDPNKITIFGESAGGGSVHFHYISPLSKDLINGAIAQSGVALGAWAVAPGDEASINAKRLGEFLNCSTTSSKEMIDCLKKVDGVEIIKQDFKFTEWDLHPLLPFKPVIEPNLPGAFITETPEEIIKSGKTANAPLMTGITGAEGAFQTAVYYNDSKLVNDLRTDFNRIAPLIMWLNKSNPHNDDIAKRLKEHYLGNKDIDESTKSELTNLITDLYFAAPANFAVNLHSNYSKQPVYYYLFNYRGTKTWAPLFGDATYDYGVCHCDDLLYLLSMDSIFGKIDPNESEQKVIDLMTTLWYNFAKTGNPTPNTDDTTQVKWKPVEGNDLDYYSIKSGDDVSMQKHLFEERAKIWEELPTGHQISSVNLEI